MHPYPHVYEAAAESAPAGLVTVTAGSLPTLHTSSPPQFDGPEGNWSPETLLCAAVADCLILTFRAVARASKLEWLGMSCSTQGTLERVDGNARFTRFVSKVTLRVPAGSDAARARLLLEKSEHACLIANSLTAQRELVAEILEG
ncbi:MAG: OsmC family protein [Steroidobacteraceae bacterium]